MRLCIDLYFIHVGGLRAALSVYFIELDLLAFVQRFEAFSLNGREVHEQIFTFIRSNEAVPFFRIKPFYCTFQSNYLQYRLTSAEAARRLLYAKSRANIRLCPDYFLRMHSISVEPGMNGSLDGWRVHLLPSDSKQAISSGSSGYGSQRSD